MRTWTPYLRLRLRQPSDADRGRLEALAGAALPDRYWQLACQHQGEVLGDADDADADAEQINLGVLLLVVSPGEVGKPHASYCVEHCFRNLRSRYPPGLFPFADDTGGNVWAFDFRRDATNPAVVFIDHEEAGEDGVSWEADSFDAFMLLADIA